MNANKMKPQQQGANDALLVKSESSANVDPEYALNSSYEVLVSMKIFDNETTKQLSEEYCLIQNQGTVGQLVTEARNKFTPAQYTNKGTLKLRNVTVFSARFNLEVSVALDSLANEGTKYTANFLYSASDVSSEGSPTNSKHVNGDEPQHNAIINSQSAEMGTQELLASIAKKKEHLSLDVQKLESKLSKTQETYAQTKEHLTRAEKSLVTANQKRTQVQSDLTKVEKSVKTQLETMKQRQKEVEGQKKDADKLKEEKKTLADDIQSLRNKIVKKTQEVDNMRAELDKLAKKKKGMEHQMGIYKKELSDEMDGLNNLIKRKENLLKECENLQAERERSVRCLEDLRNDELMCKQRLDTLQEEEQNFHTMLKELKEQTLVQIQEQRLREQQAAAIEGGDNTTANELAHNGQSNAIDAANGLELANEVPVEEAIRIRDRDRLALSPIRRSYPAATNSKAFTVPCIYFQQGDCFRGDKCTFIHDEALKQKYLERKRRNPKEQRRHQQSDGSKGASAPSTGFGREVKRVKRGDDSGRKENSSIELVEKAQQQQQSKSSVPMFGQSAFGKEVVRVVDLVEKDQQQRDKNQQLACAVEELKQPQLKNQRQVFVSQPAGGMQISNVSGPTSAATAEMWLPHHQGQYNFIPGNQFIGPPSQNRLFFPPVNYDYDPSLYDYDPSQQRTFESYPPRMGGGQWRNKKKGNNNKKGANRQRPPELIPIRAPNDLLPSTSSSSSAAATYRPRIMESNILDRITIDE